MIIWHSKAAVCSTSSVCFWRVCLYTGIGSGVAVFSVRGTSVIGQGNLTKKGFYTQGKTMDCKALLWHGDKHMLSCLEMWHFQASGWDTHRLVDEIPFRLVDELWLSNHSAVSTDSLMARISSGIEPSLSNDADSTPGTLFSQAVRSPQFWRQKMMQSVHRENCADSHKRPTYDCLYLICDIFPSASSLRIHCEKECLYLTVAARIGRNLLRPFATHALRIGRSVSHCRCLIMVGFPLAAPLRTCTSLGWD